MKSSGITKLALALLPFLVESLPTPSAKSLRRDGTSFQHPHPRAPYDLPLKAVSRASRTSGLRPRGSVAALIDPAQQRDFLVAVSLGGQTVDLDIDTGSSNTWSIVDGWSCVQGFACDFGPSISVDDSFTVYSNVTFFTNYFDKTSATGALGSTTVEVAGVTVNNQDVGLVNSVSLFNESQSNAHKN